jgi:hypothetical protein
MLGCQKHIYRRASFINGALKVTACFKSACLSAAGLNQWEAADVTDYQTLPEYPITALFIQ